jgi:DNA-binding transcriptional regulator YiaG
VKHAELTEMDATERALMRRYELSVTGFDPHTPELEHRFRTELARRGWTRRIIRGSREPPLWRNDCPRDVQDWLCEFQELSGFSSHEVGAMIRADSDMRNKQFRIFIDEIQLLGSDDSSEIEYQYLKACAVRLIPPRDVKLESEDERAVSPGHWKRKSTFANGREHCIARALQTSWEPQSQTAWQGPTVAQVKAILRYIGGAQAEIAAKLGVDARSLRHWKQGVRTMTPQCWQLLMILAGFPSGWIYDSPLYR